MYLLLKVLCMSRPKLTMQTTFKGLPVCSENGNNFDKQLNF